MHIGWYKVTENGIWTRAGGHNFNVYGYRYQKSLGEDRLTPKIVNPASAYLDLQKKTYDWVEMSKIDQPSGVQYTKNGPYVLHGPGFQGKQKAVVEDLLVFLPTAK